jgi:hypothetical protein
MNYITLALQVYLRSGMRVLESIAEEGPCREQRDVLEFELCMVGLQVLTLSLLLPLLQPLSPEFAAISTSSITTIMAQTTTASLMRSCVSK